MLDLPSLAESLIARKQIQAHIAIPPESESDTAYIESSSWQDDLEAFHSDGGAVEVEE